MRLLTSIAPCLALLVSLAGSVAQAGTPPQILFEPSSQTAGIGASVEFFSIASGDPVLAYQWYFDGAPMAGATSGVLSIPNVQTANQGSYQLVVTNSSGSASSSVAVLQVLLAPGVSGETYPASLVVGASAAFSVTATGQPPLTYQWNFDGAPIPGATNSTYNLAPVQTANAGTYQVFIANAYGQTNSPPMVAKVTLAPVIEATASSGPAPIGGSASFTAYVQGAPPLSYQWYFQPTPGMTNLIPGATNSIYTITNVQSSNLGLYQIVASNSYGSALSAPLVLALGPGVAPAISAQPVNQTVPAGFLVQFQVLASGTTPLAYQWLRNGTAVPGATSPTLALMNAQSANAGSFQVVVTNAYGAVTSSVAALTVTSQPAQAAGTTFSSTYSFSGATDGSGPESTIIIGQDRFPYLTTSGGGANDQASGGDGTVSCLATKGEVFWTLSLSPATGSHPAAGLVQSGSGLLYGTAVDGGAGYGTVFVVSTNRSVSLLYAFTNGIDGANPHGALVIGNDGYLYGTTQYGGVNDASRGGDGTVFKMTTNGALVWAVSLNGADGRTPEAGLVQDGGGVLYGVTSAGGANNISGGGDGAIFSITTNGLLTSLYSFTGGADGSLPLAGLALGPDGALYGATTAGGDFAVNAGFGLGTLFRITTNGTFMTLDDFEGTNGASPEGALTVGADDNLYGTTFYGGIAFPAGYGTIFRATIDGGVTPLFSFNGGSDGANPAAGLTQISPEMFFGTTFAGGTNETTNGGDGTVFQFTSPPGPPSLEEEGFQYIEVGEEFTFTNQVFGGTPPYRFHLERGAPLGAWVNTNGVFHWTPQCYQGSTTNEITIRVVDSSVPAMSNTMTFTLIVGQCVEVSLGETPVQVGQSACVPINLFSTGVVTNVSFSVLTLADRFTNWQVSAGNDVLGLATVTAPDTSAPQLEFASPPGQGLIGSSILGYLCVTVLDRTPSAFAPLEVSDLVAISPTQGSVPSYGSEGRFILIDGQPLLDGVLTITMSSAHVPQLTLYGNPGTNYYVQYTTNLLPPATWFAVTNYSMNGLQTNFYQVSASDPMEFFRAKYIGTYIPSQ